MVRVLARAVRSRWYGNTADKIKMSETAKYGLLWGDWFVDRVTTVPIRVNCMSRRVKYVSVRGMAVARVIIYIEDYFPPPPNYCFETRFRCLFGTLRFAPTLFRLSTLKNWARKSRVAVMATF